MEVEEEVKRGRRQMVARESVLPSQGADRMTMTWLSGSAARVDRQLGSCACLIQRQRQVQVQVQVQG